MNDISEEVFDSDEWMNIIHSVLSSERKYQFHALRLTLLNSADILRHPADERYTSNEAALIVMFTLMSLKKGESRPVLVTYSYYRYIVSLSLIELTVKTLTHFVLRTFREAVGRKTQRAIFRSVFPLFLFWSRQEIEYDIKTKLSNAT